MTIISSKTVNALPLADDDDPPSAIQIKGEFAVDNCFQVWVGNNVSVTKQLLDENKKPLNAINRLIDDIAIAKKIAPFSYVPSNYLYVIAWSDDLAWQGFVGQFYQVGKTKKIYSDDDAWLVLPTEQDFDLDKSPTAGDINKHLAKFPADTGLADPGDPGWKKPTSGQPNSDPPGDPPKPARTPFTFTVAGIDAQARWIWYDSNNDSRAKYPNSPWVPFTSPPGGHNVHQEFLIFTIPLDKFIEIDDLPPPFDPLPPQLYAEWSYVDNRSPLTPSEQGTLWSVDPGETDLDFFMAWLVSHASDAKFDVHLFGLGNGVRVKEGAKTSTLEKIVVPATDQEDNSIPNSQAPGNAGIRYADGRIHVFPVHDVTFVVEGFVSPLTATLKQELTNAGKSISLAELLTYEPKLPKDSADRPRYNPLLSALRAMGLFEAMVDRMIAYLANLPPTNATEVTTLTDKLTNLKLTATSKIHISGTWWDIEVTYPSYRTIKDNVTFTGQ